MAKTIQGTTNAAEQQNAANGHAGLRLWVEDFVLLRDRRRAANRDNPDVEAQADDLLGWIRLALEERRSGLAGRIVLVLADGAWAHEGIVLRTARESEEIVPRVVTRLDRRSFDVASAVGVATHRYRRNGRSDIQPGFDPLPDWNRASAYGQAHDWSNDRFGIPLLIQASLRVPPPLMSRSAGGTRSVGGSGAWPSDCAAPSISTKRCFTRTTPMDA